MNLTSYSVRGADMTNLVIPLIGGTLSASGLVLGQLSSGTTIPLGEALAVLMAVSGVLWVARDKLTKIEDRLKSIEKELASRPRYFRDTTKECPEQ